MKAIELPHGVTIRPFRFELLSAEILGPNVWERRGMALSLHARVACRDSGRDLDIAFAEPLERVNMGAGAYFPTMVRRSLERTLLHEIDECLLVNGKHFRDPHPKR